MNQLAVVGVLLVATGAFAQSPNPNSHNDTILFQNGDRLTGTITKSDGKQLVIKTDYAGDVTVKFDAIESLSSTGDLNVTLGGKTAVGPGSGV